MLTPEPSPTEFEPYLKAQATAPGAEPPVLIASELEPRTNSSLATFEKKRRVFSQPLSVLNEQAKTRTFSVDDVDWESEFDFTKRWIPDEVASMTYLPAYHCLSEANKLRLNQLTSIGVCEQFVWFEEDLLTVALAEILKRRDVTPDLKECLENFIDEEKRHSLMFRRMLLKFSADRYKFQPYWLVKLNAIQNFVFAKVVRNPHVFLSWIWLAIFFEERTLHVSQLYRRAEHFDQNPVDPMFSRVHALHMIDEARHLQIDQYLLFAFYDRAPIWKRKLSAWLSFKIFANYRSPKRIAKKILGLLIDENIAAKNDDQAHYLRTMAKQLPILRESTAFQNALFGPKILPRTRELMSQYPEMRKVFEVLFC